MPNVHGGEPADLAELRKMLHRNYVSKKDGKFTVTPSRIVYGYLDDEGIDPYIVFQPVRRPLVGYILTVREFLDRFKRL